eukprot:624394-Rhodomonas_salina.3
MACAKARACSVRADHLPLRNQRQSLSGRRGAAEEAREPEPRSASVEEERARRSKKKGGSSAHLAQRCLQGRSRLEQVVSQLRPPPERAPLRHLTPLPVSVRAVPAVSVLA